MRFKLYNSHANVKIASIGILGAFYLTLNQACSELDFKDAKTPELEPTEYSSKLIDSEVVGREEMNRYQVQFHFKNLGASLWYLIKTHHETFKTYVFPINEKSKANGFVDSEVIHDHRYTYSLSQSPENGSISTPPFVIHIPNDIDENGFLNFVKTNSHLNVSGYRRVFLDKTFNSNGLSLNLEVDEIISHNGTIETHSNSDVAMDGVDGKSPGLINIKAKKITGNLNIILRGEEGGKGVTGIQGSTGPTGLPGNTVSLFEAAWFCYSARPMKTGDEFIKTHPARGGIGGVGLAGQIGYPGKRGGSAGELIIDVPESEEGKINLRMILARGGLGGDGGPGGPGGHGGPGGVILENFGCNGGVCCPQAPEGEIGPQGPQGLNGPIGPTGEKGKITVNGRIIFIEPENPEPKN